MTELYTRDGVLYLVFPVLEDTKIRDVERFVGAEKSLWTGRSSPRTGDYVVHVPASKKMVGDIPESVELLKDRYQLWGHELFHEQFKEKNVYVKRP